MVMPTLYKKTKNPASHMMQGFLVPGDRIELSTQGSSDLCSTTELPRRTARYSFDSILCRLPSVGLTVVFTYASSLLGRLLVLNQMNTLALTFPENYFIRDEFG